MTDSLKLLVEYSQSGSEEAFRELVNRYLGLVYSTAYRRTGGDPHLAEDVSQMVFVHLARKAKSLPKNLMLAGWLHRHTCFVASKTVRSERRRREREKQVFEMNTPREHSEANLSLIAPVLDEAINHLGSANRTAILLRFFEQLDFAAVGAAMGATENAAQKRVSRALEELRIVLQKRGIALSVSALAIALTQGTATAAPLGLATIISATALGAGTGTIFTFLSLTMSKLKLSLATGAILASITVSVFIQRQASARLLEQRELLQKQSDRLDQLKTEHEGLVQVNFREDHNPNTPEELRRLRAEAEALRTHVSNLPLRDQAIPKARMESQTSPLRRIEDTKEKGLMRLNYMKDWILALRTYAEKHGGQIPEDFTPALPYLSEHSMKQTNLATSEFQILYSGPINAITNSSMTILIREKQAWPNADGTSWARAYGFADGHSEIHRILDVTNAVQAAVADKTFDPWEMQRVLMLPPER